MRCHGSEFHRTTLLGSLDSFLGECMDGIPVLMGFLGPENVNWVSVWARANALLRLQTALCLEALVVWGSPDLQVAKINGRCVVSPQRRTVTQQFLWLGMRVPWAPCCTLLSFVLHGLSWLPSQPQCENLFSWRCQIHSLFSFFSVSATGHSCF